MRRMHCIWPVRMGSFPGYDLGRGRSNHVPSLPSSLHPSLPASVPASPFVLEEAEGNDVFARNESNHVSRLPRKSGNMLCRSRI